jgi:predicted helicase
LSAEWLRINPKPPNYYLIKPDSGELGEEWESWPAINDLFKKCSTGTETGFDDLLVAFTRSELTQRVSHFADPLIDRQSILQEFDVSEGHAADLFIRRNELRSLQASDMGQFQLRAFDYRCAILRKDLLKTNSFNVMLDLNKCSPGLVTTRQTKDRFSAFAVKGFCGHKITSSYDRSYVFPLFSRDLGVLIVNNQDTYFDRSWITWFRNLDAGTESQLVDRVLVLDIFSYTLALLNAPSYVSLFGEKLKRDWPKLPMPGSFSIFRALIKRNYSRHCRSSCYSTGQL